MPRWDDPRGRHDAERGRWRREPMRESGGPPGRERRSFGDDDQAARFGRDFEEDWRRDRHAALQDREQVGYRRRFEDAGAAGYDRPWAAPEDETSPVHGGEPWAYAGQEYGLEHIQGGGAPDWGKGLHTDRRANFDFDDPGVGQSQAGYSATAQTHVDQEFDVDYLRWRDAQLRAHDRDYEDWRREQMRQYDDQYRQFRSERQRSFGRAFHEWRSQREGEPRGPSPERKE